MSISMECYFSSLVVARLVSQAALFFSFVLRWFLCDSSWWPTTTAASSFYSDDAESAPEASARRAAAVQAVRDGLRVSTYGQLVGADGSAAVASTTTCAVCLGEVHGHDSVWELGNCRHLFHRGCLNRWLEHDERLTCPLCRAPLLSAPPPFLAGASSAAAASPELSWAVERLLYLFGDDLLFAPLR